MTNIETQLVALGAGPGGYAAAFLAADKGIQVTLIDADEKPGGVCLRRGCIPSKALLHAARLITDAREAGSWGITFKPPEIDLNTLRATKDTIVDKLSSHLAELAKRRKVNWIRARATFEDSTTLALDNGDRVRFQTCILATGSSPTRLPAFDLKSPRVLDSTLALQLPDVPKTLLVVGGGYIGLELGTVYAALGSQVTVVELTGTLLPGVDADLVRPLHARLEKQFHKIYLNTKVSRIEEVKDGIRATLEGQGVSAPEATFERVLVAVGRRPNSSNLGLEKTRVQLDEKGFVKVDERRRTTDEHIYAIGDVAGEP
ncbi:MAG TPA: NAD(P)/FAD-dependent oxidoreductase, partial [Pirellulales bacterium]|nr:NAD(P)/FAD-dependent oxidoreductase [Pirellulales bacterium]